MLTLQEAEDQVRVLTRHVTDTTRLPQPDLRIHLNGAYRERRRALRVSNPELYLLISPEIDVGQDDRIQLSSVSNDFEAIFRVDFKQTDRWKPVESADNVDYNQHKGGAPTFRREGDYIFIGPDVRDTFTIRVLFYEHPEALDEAADIFDIPEALERPLIYEACSFVAVADADDHKRFENLRDAKLLEVAPELAILSTGQHKQRAGLRVVMGY